MSDISATPVKAPLDASGEHQTTTGPGAQADQNISILPNADIPVEWEGNPLYFQTGKKAGTLKPVATKKQTEFEGLRFDELKPTTTQPAPLPPDAKADKLKLKAERKSSDARVGAKIAMRILDTLTKWISRGTYGATFTVEQRRERNEYREELENDWREYLLTLDIPLHPALIVAFGSINYVADAFTTEAGQQRAETFKEKVISKIAVGMFSRTKK